MSDFADYVVDLVREQLRRMPAFKGVTRDDFDNNIFADLERDIRDALEVEIEGLEDAAYRCGRDDAEYEAELKAEAAKKKQNTKQRRTA
jgi:hypothetical protein